MYGTLIITAPNGAQYEIDGEDLCEIAEDAEANRADRSPYNDWEKDIKVARKLARWIVALPLQHETPGSWDNSFLTGLPEDEECSEDCDCRECHDWKTPGTMEVGTHALSAKQVRAMFAAKDSQC